MGILNEKFSTADAAKIVGIDRKIIDAWFRRGFVNCSDEALGSNRRSYYFSFTNLMELLVLKTLGIHLNVGYSKIAQLLKANEKMLKKYINSQSAAPLLLSVEKLWEEEENLSFKYDADDATQAIHHSFATVYVNLEKIKKELLRKVEQFNK
jgi:hypothetical protein